MKTLKEIMSRNIQVVRPDSPIQEAARHMKRFDTGVVPVCDDERIHGMLTDRDIVLRGVAEGRLIEGLKVSDVMTPGVPWLYEDQRIDDAAELMKKERVRRIIVVDRKKQLVGLVSLGDLATAGEDEDLHGDALQGISESSEFAFSKGKGGARAGSLFFKSLSFLLFGGLIASAGYVLLESQKNLMNGESKLATAREQKNRSFD